MAASAEVFSSKKNRYNMQCLVNMGFSKQQAIYGVKRALEGSGSLDVAQQHASWRCDAELLMEKRRRLDSLKPLSTFAPQPLGTILSFTFFSLGCTADGILAFIIPNIFDFGVWVSLRSFESRST